KPLHVPEFDGPVIAGRCQHFAVGAESDAVDLALMTAQNQLGLLGIWNPDLDGITDADRNTIAATVIGFLGAECGALYPTAADANPRDFLAGGDIPHHDCLRADYEKALAPMVKRHARKRLLIRKRLRDQRRPGVGVPDPQLGVAFLDSPAH